MQHKQTVATSHSRHCLTCTALQRHDRYTTVLHAKPHVPHEVPALSPAKDKKHPSPSERKQGNINCGADVQQPLARSVEHGSRRARASCTLGPHQQQCTATTAWGPAWWRELPSRHRLALATAASFVICNMDKVNMSVAIIPMAAHFGWSPSVSGLVQSAFFYGYMLSQLPSGFLTSRYGGRRVLPAGVALWSAATCAVPLMAHTVPGLCLSRAAVGLGEAAAPSAAVDIIARSTPPSERSRTTALVFCGLHVGSVTGLLTAPVIIQACGWEVLFVAFGAVGLAWCAWFQQVLMDIAVQDPLLDVRLGCMPPAGSAAGAAGSSDAGGASSDAAGRSSDTADGPSDATVLALGPAAAAAAAAGPTPASAQMSAAAAGTATVAAAAEEEQEEEEEEEVASALLPQRADVSGGQATAGDGSGCCGSSSSSSHVSSQPPHLPPPQTASPIPYRAFLRSRPVQALAFTHLCHNWLHYSMLAWLPTYLTSALSLDLNEAASTALFPPLAGVVAAAVAGPLADGLVARGVPLGRVRKGVQAVAFLVPAACLVAAAACGSEGGPGGMISATSSSTMTLVGAGAPQAVLESGAALGGVVAASGIGGINGMMAVSEGAAAEAEALAAAGGGWRCGVSPVDTVAAITVALGMSAFSTGGLYCTHQDLSPKYASALLSLTNTFAAIPGVIGVAVVGLLYDTTHSWQAALFAPSAALLMAGALVYGTACSNDPVDFDAADNGPFAWEERLGRWWWGRGRQQ